MHQFPSSLPLAKEALISDCKRNWWQKKRYLWFPQKPSQNSWSLPEILGKRRKMPKDQQCCSRKHCPCATRITLKLSYMWPACGEWESVMIGTGRKEKSSYGADIWRSEDPSPVPTAPRARQLQVGNIFLPPEKMASPTQNRFSV